MISFGVRDFRFAPILPVIPYAIAQSVTNPTVNVFEFDLNIRYTKVIPPSPRLLIKKAFNIQY